MIRDRIIVFKREGNILLLPTKVRKAIESPANAPAKVFFMGRVVAHDESSGILSVKTSRDIVDYGQYNTSIEVNSDLLLTLNINKVNFVDLSSNSSFSYLPQNKVPYQKDFSYKENLLKEESIAIGKREDLTKAISRRIEKANMQIELSVNELKFSDGKVCFDYYISQTHRKENFEISNSFIKKEFDSVKNYFPKVLNISKFGILLQFEHLDGKLLKHESISNHISMINEAVFELVEDLYILDKVVNERREEILSIAEIANVASAEMGSDNLKDPNLLLNKLISFGKTRHYYHLRYLSEKHASNTYNLRLTGKPLSFIFLLTIPNGFCLIWETYSTEEATYVWRICASDLLQIETIIEQTVDLIKWLRNNNKTAFLKEKPDNFTWIKHDYSGDDLGFKKWKTQLEEFLLK